jgi:hypothetical protein
MGFLQSHNVGVTFATHGRLPGFQEILCQHNATGGQPDALLLSFP